MAADSDANRWVAEHSSKCIQEYGVVFERLNPYCMGLAPLLALSARRAASKRAFKIMLLHDRSCFAGEDARYCCLVFRIQIVCDQSL